MCLFPWNARRCPDGGRPIPDREGELILPCGKCDECLTLRSSGWALRARHEISMHQDNCFITLTYDNSCLPSNIVLKDPFQKFMKRLRKRTKKKLTYMVSHEYGTKTKRPHHHVIVFGYEPATLNFLKNSKGGNPLFTSPELDELWEHGHHSVGEANEKTAFYIASYALKGKDHEVIEDGEIHTVSDTFDASKRPAIGKRYLLANAKQLVDSGDPLPRYYQKLLEKFFPDLLQEYQDRVSTQVKSRSSQERLAKVTISSAKKNLKDDEFRTAPDNLSSKQYQAYLKTEVGFNRFQGEKA